MLHDIPGTVPPRLLQLAPVSCTAVDHHYGLSGHHFLDDGTVVAEHLCRSVCHDSDDYPYISGFEDGVYGACDYGSFMLCLPALAP